jgi:hypothetical protein
MSTSPYLYAPLSSFLIVISGAILVREFVDAASSFLSEGVQQAMTAQARAAAFALILRKVRACHALRQLNRASRLTLCL